MTRPTHTFARLEISSAAFHQIKKKLKEAGYSHLFVDDNTIDMTGIGISPKIAPPKFVRRLLTGKEFRYAAQHGLSVYYELESYAEDSFECRKCVIKNNGEVYGIGEVDLNANEFKDNADAVAEFYDACLSIYTVKGVKYSD